jgi:hypothetical protein
MKSFQSLLIALIVVVWSFCVTVSAFLPSNFAISHSHQPRPSHSSAPSGKERAPDSVSASVNLHAHASKSTAPNDNNNTNTDTDAADTPTNAQLARASVNLHAHASKSTAPNDNNNTNTNTDTDAADTPTNAQLAQLVQELTKKLTEESTRSKKVVQELTDELTSFKEKTEDKQKETDQSLQGIRAAFDPATKYALMETAVYTFVEVGLQKSGWVDKCQHPEVDKIQYAASPLASRVLTLLLAGEPPKKYNWSGPNKSIIGTDDLFVVGLQVLGALVAFIENEHTSQADLKEWPSERNAVAHNGKLLDALHGGNVREGVEAKTAELIVGMRADFDKKSKETIHPQPENWEEQLGQELDKVVKALSEKGLTPKLPDKKAAFEILERTCSPEKA